MVTLITEIWRPLNDAPYTHTVTCVNDNGEEFIAYMDSASRSRDLADQLRALKFSRVKITPA